MGTIKKLFKRLGDNYISFFKNYLFTNIAVMISTIITVIFLNEDTAYDLFKYELFFCINSFTIENFFKNKKSRIIGFIFGYIISFILGYLFNNYEDEFANFLVFYLISIASINLYHIIKETKLELSSYLHQIFSNLVSTTIINIVLNIGIFAVLGILHALLIPNSDFDIFLRTEIIIIGFYTIPAYLYAFINKEVHITDLANILLKYVIIPLTYIALVIIYLYIFKIIIRANMPSNSVFGIVFALFIECMPIFVLYKSFDFKNKFFNFIATNITFVFIPLYILQAYAMIIRVTTYGLTKARYLGLMVLIVEAIILFLMKFKKQKYLINVLYVFIIASFITFLMPGINYEDASIKYQVNVIENLLNNREIKDLNEEERIKLANSYEYLRDEKALDRLSIKLDEEVIIREPYTSNRRYFYEVFSNSNDTIDISKYSKMQIISADDDITNNKIKIKGYEIDLSDAITKLINHEQIKELIYNLDENNDFYVIGLTINGENKKADYYSINGYLLTK